MDPIQTAKELLELHRSKEENETIVEDVVEDIVEDLETEEVEEIEEIEEAKKVKEDDDEDEVEDDEDDDDEEEVDEATTAQASVVGKGKGAKAGKILDGDDNEVPGAKATDVPKGKDTDAKNKKSVKTKPSMAKATMAKEHADALFAGEELSEDFKGKATTIFEAALNENLETYIEAVDAHYATQLEEETVRVREDLTEKLNDYMGYVVDEWMKDNELALERGLRGDIAESFMTGLKDLFTSHYIDVPEEKYDLLEEMNSKFDTLTEEINTQIHSNVELKKEIQELKCKEIFHELSEGLVDTEVEKFQSLSEGIEFDTTDQYKEKLEVIKEGYFSDASESSVNFDVESNDVDDNELPKSGTMSHYTNAISRHMKK